MSSAIGAPATADPINWHTPLILPNGIDTI